MGVTAKQTFSIAILIAFALMVASYLGWFDMGYGKVSERAYEFSKSLYSACLNQNEMHLGKVERLLAETDPASLTENERVWLEQIVKRARAGDWKNAAKSARRMLDDQVKY